MRQFYLRFKKGRTLCDQLHWSHYRYLLPIDDNKFNYYIMIVSKLNLLVRELRERIKTKEYERLGEKTVGVIICKKENKYVIEYCTNPNIFITIYQPI